MFYNPERQNVTLHRTRLLLDSSRHHNRKGRVTLVSQKSKILVDDDDTKGQANVMARHGRAILHGFPEGKSKIGNKPRDRFTRVKTSFTRRFVQTIIILCEVDYEK